MNDTPIPVLIGLDWGTSSLRAQLLGAHGAVLETRARPWGIMHLPDGDFSAAFREIVGDWRERWPKVPAIAAGMVGSRGGWREVPYVECPADVGRIAAAMLRLDSGCGPLHIVPGVMQGGRLPNVLRGEETQVFGALALEPRLADRAVLVLPGTHSKWVSVRDSRLEHFSTYMTGELFAVLRDHSILGRPALGPGAQDEPGEAGGKAGADAFRLGVANARDSGAEGAGGRLFTARSLWLTGELSARASLDYLSGLLIGEELRSVVAGLNGAACPPLVLLGETALCDRYRHALDFFGITDVRVMEHATRAGLWRIAAAAGLVDVQTTAHIRS